MANRKFQTMDIVGLVESVTINQYSTEVIINCDANNPEVKFPQRIRVECAEKNEKVIPVVKELGKGDEIKVTIAPWIVEGVSQKTGKPYSISQNRIITCFLIRKNEEATTGSGDAEQLDIPF